MVEAEEAPLEPEPPAPAVLEPRPELLEFELEPVPFGTHFKFGVGHSVAKSPLHGLPSQACN